MRKIPDSFVEELRRQVDIVDVVSEYVQLRRAGRSYTGLCPFHTERTPSFSVSSERQMFHCFGCGAGGTVIRFVMDMEGIDFVEAVVKLAQRANLILPFNLDAVQSAPEETSRFQRMKDAHELAAKLYSYILMNTPAGVQALTYLEKRGISRQTIVDFQIGYAPERSDMMVSFLRKRGFEDDVLLESGIAVAMGQKVLDRFRGRVIIPITDAQGHVIAFGGRTMVPEGNPKYLNSPETPIFQKGSVLFNLHMARKSIRKARTAVVMEGYMDVISAWQAGLQNTVATMGTSFSEEHASTLERYADTLILSYDGDSAGRKATERTLTAVEKSSLIAKVAPFPDGVDPDEFIGQHGPAEFVHHVTSQCITPVMFRLGELRRKANLQSVAGRTEFLRAALQLVGTQASPIEQETELRTLSQEFQVSYDTLKEELQLIAKQTPKKWVADNPHGSRREGFSGTMHGGNASSFVPLQVGPLPKGHIEAGNRILQWLMSYGNAAEFLMERGVDELPLPEQTALLALLYGFRMEQPDGDVSVFLDNLEDRALVGLASQLLLAESVDLNPSVIEDCLRTISIHRLNTQHQEALIQLQRAQHNEDPEAIQYWNSLISDIQREISQLKIPQPKGKVPNGFKEAGK